MVAAHTIVTVPPLSETPTADDERLARLAAGLIVAARNGDEAGVGRLLSGLEPYRLARLFMILGAVADRDAVLFAAGFGTPENLRWCFNAYEAMRRTPGAVIPPHVAEGWRMYRRVRARRTLARKRQG